MESYETSFLSECREDSWFTQHQSLMLNEHDQERFFDRACRSTQDYYLIARESKRLLGVVNVSDIDWISRCGNVGMMAKPTVRGCPATRKLPEAVTDFAFEFLNLHRVQAEVLDTNPAAMKFDLDLGYRIEGRRRSAVFKCNAYHDSVLIAMLRSEWADSSRVKDTYGGVCNTQFRDRKSFDKVIERYSKPAPPRTGRYAGEARPPACPPRKSPIDVCREMGEWDPKYDPDGTK